jgi:hypothetical protein
MHSRELGLYVHVSGFPTWVTIEVNMPMCLELSKASNLLPALQKLSFLALQYPRNKEWRDSLKRIVTWAGKIRKGIDEGDLSRCLSVWACLWSRICLNSGHWVFLEGAQGHSWIISHNDSLFVVEDVAITVTEPKV